MDGPLADFEAGVASAMPDRGFSPVPFDASYRHFYAADNYGDRYGPDAAAAVIDVIDAPGFYDSLPVVDGAPDGLEALLSAGFEVRICTAPRTSNPTCSSDKFAWVRRHLGREWVSRVVICRDKTVVRGEALIDDRPEVSGSFDPTWAHVLWDAPYNRAATPEGGRLLGWSDLPRFVEVWNQSCVDGA